jgi:hypothetical protein
VTNPNRPPASHGTSPRATRTTHVVAIAALVLALVAVGFAAWQVFAPGGDGCQSVAWDVTPAEEDLPLGWTPTASQYDLNRKTMSFLGPLPEDEMSSQAVIYATVTCFPDGAADAVTRSQAAADDAGQSVIERDDLGDQSFSAVDETGATFLQLRDDRIVVYLAGSADTSATEVDELASAFDKALGGDGGTITPPTIAPSDDLAGESFDPGESLEPETPAAPDLVAALPTEVGAITLISDSATGGTILGEDQGSRAILAALRAADKEPEDLRVAQAYDETGESDLSILAVTVEGLPVDETEQIVLDSWLAATGAGVTKDTVTLDGETWTRIDYGDGGTLDYVLRSGPNVFVVTTADPALAEQAAAALP